MGFSEAGGFRGCRLGDGLSEWNMWLESLPKSPDEHMIAQVFSWWREAGERLRDLILWPLQIVLKDLLFLAHRSESYSSQSSSCVRRYITSSLFAAFLSVEWGLFLLPWPRLDFLWETQQSPLLDSSTPVMNKKGCLRLKIFRPCKLVLANTFHLTFLLVG